MHGEHCRLYDEQLLKSIMVSTGLSVLDYLKVRSPYDDDDICRYIEHNADAIIEQTIDGLNRSGPRADDEADAGVGLR